MLFFKYLKKWYEQKNCARFFKTLQVWFFEIFGKGEQQNNFARFFNIL